MSRVIHRYSDPRDKSRGYSNLTPSEFGCALYDVLFKFSTGLQAGENNSEKIPGFSH